MFGNSQHEALVNGPVIVRALAILTLTACSPSGDVPRDSRSRYGTARASTCVADSTAILAAVATLEDGWNRETRRLTSAYTPTPPLSWSRRIQGSRRRSSARWRPAGP